MQPNRESYKFWAEEVCRYGDTDRQGHVNNAVFATFAESGRVLFLRGGETPLAPDGSEFVIVKLTIDFRAELQWTDRVDIGTGTLRIGNTSFAMGQGMFRGETCVATAESVLVLLDTATRKPKPLPQGLRDRLAEFAL